MTAVTYLNNITQMTTGTTWSPILPQGDWLSSPSGLYSAVQQSDGNFVIYRGTDPGTGPALWASNTYHGANDQIAYAAFVTQYGNLANQSFLTDLVIPGSPPYSQPFNAPDFFLSKMNGTFGNYFASLSDDGVLAVYPGQSGNATGSVSVKTTQSDPLKSITLKTIAYDLDHTIYNSQDTVYGVTAIDNNQTSTQQVYPLSLALNYSTSQTFSWNLSQATAASISTTEKISVPGVSEVSATEQLTSTTTLSSGMSTTSGQQQTYTAGGTITVPPFTEYATTITGQKVDATVPYTFTGTALYASGAEAPVYGSGEFEGVDTGAFAVETVCVQAPGGCPTPPGALLVPEPASAMILIVVLAAGIMAHILWQRNSRLAWSR